jgi:hypothetical protein
VAENVDRDALMRIVEHGTPQNLPVLRHQASGNRLQGRGDGSDAEETELVRDGDAPTSNPVPTAPQGSEMNGPQDLKPAASLKAEA